MDSGRKLMVPSKRGIESITKSPLRENLLRDFSIPNKKLCSVNQRYTPKSCDDKDDDLLNQILTQQENKFDFKPIPKKFPDDTYSEVVNHIHLSPNYNILKPADLDIDDNVEKRSRFHLNAKILENEILGESAKKNRDDSYDSPLKGSPQKSLLDFSPNKKSINSSGLFEKSPSIPYSTATKNVLCSPRKKLCLPEMCAYKVLDAPGIMDDFYLKLIDWSDDNKIAVALDTKFYIYNYENENVKELIDYSRSKEPITAVAWSKLDPKKVLIGTAKGRIQYWDTEADKCILQRLAHRDRIGTLDWNGHCFTSGSKDKQIFHFDSREKTSSLPVLSFNKHSHEICGLKWSPGGHMLASGGNDNKLIIWSLHNNKPMTEFHSHSAAVRALAWSPHQNGILASGGGSADRTIKIWNTLTFSLNQSMSTISQICNLAWSIHSKRLLSTHGYNDNTISVWDFPEMTTVVRLKGHSSRVLQMALSPDGQDIVTGAGDETVRFWKVFPIPEVSKRKVQSLIKNIPTLR